MNTEKRKKLIKSKMAELGITQVKVAEDLGLRTNSIWIWIHKGFPSARIENYFKEKFGEGFLKQLKNVA